MNFTPNKCWIPWWPCCPDVDCWRLSWGADGLVIHHICMDPLYHLVSAPFSPLLPTLNSIQFARCSLHPPAALCTRLLPLHYNAACDYCTASVGALTVRYVRLIKCFWLLGNTRLTIVVAITCISVQCRVTWEVKLVHHQSTISHARQIKRGFQIIITFRSVCPPS
jgi:hypothetical protein